MSKHKKVLAHLKRGPITQNQALRLYGAGRLASIVHRLKEQGYLIDKQMLKNKDGNGRYARYWMERKGK